MKRSSIISAVFAVSLTFPTSLAAQAVRTGNVGESETIAPVEGTIEASPEGSDFTSEMQIFSFNPTAFSSVLDRYEACMLRHDIPRSGWLRYREFFWEDSISRAKDGGRGIVHISRPTVTIILGKQRAGPEIVIACGRFHSRAYNPLHGFQRWNMQVLDKDNRPVASFTGGLSGGCPWRDQVHEISEPVIRPGVTPRSVFDLVATANFSQTGGKFDYC